mgnify:CR=1 FL=1
MSDQPTSPDSISPSEFPPELQDALRSMSKRGPVVDMGTGATVAEAGRLVGDEQKGNLVACVECARAIALGWWGAISRHAAYGPDKPVCVLCCEGEATYTAEEWFVLAGQLVTQRARDGQRKTWQEDAIRGLGIQPPADGA